MISPADTRWMQHALALARRGEGLTRPNPPVGAVVVRAGKNVGQGWHRRAGGAHAEVAALRRAGDAARGATLYVTLEPCSTQGRTPPCTDLVLRHGPGRVVVGVRDPNPVHRGRGLARLRRAGVTVTTGCCGDEAARLLAPFRTWIETGRPYVTLKLGMTADGRIADGRGRSRWITSAASRKRVDALRARCDAVMVGAGTAMADDPSLRCRGRRRDGLYRVIVDSTGRLPLSARVLNDAQPGQTIVATTAACSERRRRAYEAKGAVVWVLRTAHGRVSLKALARRLGAFGLLHVVCEGGGELAASLVRDGLVDRALLFVAPCLLGGGGVPAIGGAGWPLAGAPGLTFESVEPVGPDVLIEAVTR